LTLDRTRASAVGGRRLTAWAMARPFPYLGQALGQVTDLNCPQIFSSTTFKILRVQSPRNFLSGVTYHTYVYSNT
jgi:hypothetical protein